MKKSILTTIALALFAFAANAQTSSTASHTVKVIASPVLDVQMTSLADVVFNFTTPAHYENGIIRNAATELKVKSTKPWTIKASGGAANFSSLVSGNATEIAVDKLSIGATLFVPGTPAVLDGSGAVITPAVPDSYNLTTFTDLAVSPGITAKTGSKGGNGVSGNTFKLDYKMNPGYIADDTYSMVVTYTISQN